MQALDSEINERCESEDEGGSEWTRRGGLNEILIGRLKALEVG